MPADRGGDRHAISRRAYQLDDEPWDRFGRKAEAVGRKRATITAELVEWWLGDRPEPPARPD